MARKSRKNMMPQAAVQEAVQQNEKELLRTAAYARLSVENGGHETEAVRQSRSPLESWYRCQQPSSI